MYFLVRCEHSLCFFWGRFKHIGDRELLEIITTSKEIMSFHDHAVVVFRFSCSRNWRFIQEYWFILSLG